MHRAMTMPAAGRKVSGRKNALRQPERRTEKYHEKGREPLKVHFKRLSMKKIFYKTKMRNDRN